MKYFILFVFLAVVCGLFLSGGAFLYLDNFFHFIVSYLPSGYQYKVNTDELFYSRFILYLHLFLRGVFVSCCHLLIVLSFFLGF